MQRCQGSAIEDRQTFGQAGAPRRVAVFVPPAVFDEEVVVFDLPMIADVGQQVRGRDAVGIETGHKVTAVVRCHAAIGRDQVSIDPQGDATTREGQLVANVVGIAQGEPQPAAICQSPLFSWVSAAGGR